MVDSWALAPLCQRVRILVGEHLKIIKYCTRLSTAGRCSKDSHKGEKYGLEEILEKRKGSWKRWLLSSNFEKTNSREREYPKQKSKETGMGTVQADGRSFHT